MSRSAVGVRPWAPAARRWRMAVSVCLLWSIGCATRPVRVVSEERQTRVLPAREVRRGHPREGRCDVSVVTRARPGAIEVFATGKAHCKRVMESEVVEVVTERRRADTSLDFTCASLELLGAYVLGMVLTAVLQDCTTSKDPGPRETRCGEAPGIVGLFTAAVVGGVDALVTRDRRADRTYERERPPRVQTSEVECGACPLAGYVLPAQPLTGHKAVRMWPGQGYAYLAVPVPPDGQAPREVRVEQVGTAVTATGIVAIPTDQVLVARSSASGSASHGQGGAAGGACDTRQFSETGSDPVLQALERGAWLPPQAADFVERHPCQAPCRAGDDAACQLTCEIGMRLSQRLGRHGRAREALAVTKAGLPS